VVLQYCRPGDWPTINEPYENDFQLWSQALTLHDGREPRNRFFSHTLRRPAPSPAARPPRSPPSLSDTCASSLRCVHTVPPARDPREPLDEAVTLSFANRFVGHGHLSFERVEE
jgi:hypothetical protein